ncbi:MAG: exosortase/archaeosortase family protein [Opitutales bacterium]
MLLSGIAEDTVSIDSNIYSVSAATETPKSAEKPIGFTDLPQMTQYAAWVIVGFFGFIIYDQIYWWQIDEEYSFGFIVPLFVGYVIFDRWPRMQTLFDKGYVSEVDPDNPSRLRPCKGPLDNAPEWISKLVDFIFGSALVLGTLVMGFGALLRALQAPQNPSSLAISWGTAWIVLSLVYFFTKETVHGSQVSWAQRMRIVALFIFPSFIWIISAPLLSVLENNISLFLLNRVTEIVFAVFEFLGYALVREGNILTLPQGQVGVADACSGIRSMTACLFAGSFLGAVFLQKFWKKALLIVVAMCFAFFTNILRSLFLTGWAYAYGSEAIEGTVHDVAGYAVLGLTCVGLIALLPLFNIRFEFADEEEAEAS